MMSDITAAQEFLAQINGQLNGLKEQYTLRVHEARRRYDDEIAELHQHFSGMCRPLRTQRERLTELLARQAEKTHPAVKLENLTEALVRDILDAQGDAEAEQTKSN
jgi:nitrogen fixation/metabolism regulation signal transduction histidine kinase